MLELDGDFFGRKKKCVGAGISGGGPPWAHEAGGRAQGGRVRPPPSWMARDSFGRLVAFLTCTPSPLEVF